jgi:hypothetical protein
MDSLTPFKSKTSFIMKENLGIHGLMVKVESLEDLQG